MHYIATAHKLPTLLFITDIQFALFALSFFITRIVIYPRYVSMWCRCAVYLYMFMYMFMYIHYHI